MQKLLGMCIDNTNEMSHTIKMSFDVQDIMVRINDQLQQTQGSSEGESEVIFNELTQMLGNISKTRQAMVDSRANGKANLTPYQWANGDPVDVQLPSKEEKK